MSIDDIDYVNLKGTVSKKAKIIIPMGNAKNNEEFIKDMQKHSVSMSMSFQIDNDDDDD